MPELVKQETSSRNSLLQPQTALNTPGLLLGITDMFQKSEDKTACVGSPTLHFNSI